MARLNEPPAVAPGPGAETVEVVKRRFLRQNREFAKINSQQSVRIRALETESSRILAENLHLREQVLQLQNALEAQANQPSAESIDAVKARLEAKLHEFGSMVAELGCLQRVDGKSRRRSQIATRKRPDERQWRSALGLQEVENAMMPTIVEDKYYPRRTINAEDILNEPESQSPDIGPPAVSRFDSEEPITFDCAIDDQQNAESEPVLPVNLETRRKRRESGPKADLRRVSIFESPPESAEERTAKTVRLGAKRKFSVQEDEDKPRSQANDFTFTHRSGQGGDGGSDASSRPMSPERPVLGSKSVNTDPVLSPKKQRSAVTAKPDKKPMSNPKSSRGRLTITRTAQTELLPVQLPDTIPIPTTEIQLDALPPKTPAVEDVFSPPSTEPSTGRPENKDTPPPGNLNELDQSGCRPSRRARAAVSYKEPSLNVKMRRPGKEMVDAVQPNHDRRASVEPTSVTHKSTIKREPDDASMAWKSLPASTDNPITNDIELGSPLRDKLDRVESTKSSDSPIEPPKLNSSAASNAISALISATSTAKRKTPAATPTTTQPVSSSKPTQPASTSTSASSAPRSLQADPKDSLAVFDFTPSSSPDHASSQLRARAPPTSTATSKAKPSRRHSSVPTSSSEDRKPERSRPEGALPSIHARSSTSTSSLSYANATLPKSSSAPSLNRGTGSVKGRLEKKIVNGPEGKEEGRVVGAAALTGASTGSLRAERAASRRKSMMI